jgi:hypothetical protein
VLNLGLARMMVRTWSQKPEPQRAEAIRNLLSAQDTNLTGLFLDIRAALPADAIAPFNDLVAALATWTPKAPA